MQSVLHHALSLHVCETSTSQFDQYFAGISRKEGLEHKELQTAPCQMCQGPAALRLAQPVREVLHALLHLALSMGVAADPAILAIGSQEVSVPCSLIWAW